MMTVKEAVATYGVKDCNLKYANTLAFHSGLSSWIGIAEFGAGAVTYWNDGVLDHLSRPNFDFVTLRHPPTGYHNSPANKLTYLFRRMPIRDPKQGCSPRENCFLTSPFWNKIPKGIREELKPIFKHDPNNLMKFYCGILNDHKKFLGIEEAISLMERGLFLSVAVSRSFAISPSLDAGDQAFSVYHLDNEVGVINTDYRTIMITEPVIKQEMIDLIHRTGQPWNVK